MIKRLSYTFILLSFIACNTGGEKFSFPLAEKDPIVGLASPIQLNGQSSYFLISEYFVNETLDSLQVPDEITYKLKGDTVFLIGNIKKQLSSIQLFKDGFPYYIPVLKSNEREILYSFDPQGKEHKQVNLRGSFNAWNAANTPLTFADGIWSTKLQLAPGDYEYLLLCDGKEMTDPGNDVTKDNGMGGYNSILSLPLPDPLKIPKIKTQNSAKDAIVLQSSLAHFEHLAMWNNKRITDEHIHVSDGQIKIDIPANAKKLERSYIRYWAYSDEGIGNDIFIPLNFGKPLINKEDLHRMDKHAMSMYFLLIDRFYNGEAENDKPVDDPEIHPKANYYGGDIQGVIEKLETGYFEELGTNTIWLSPITLNPEGAYGLYPTPRTKFSAYHGYWPIRSTVVDYRYGNLDQLKKLVELAHEKNINVLIDYVANHVHEEHPIYKNNPEWVTDLYLPDGSLNTERWDDQRLTTWFDTFLPTLDLSKVEVVEPMTDSALYWIKVAGIDGFRHDATKHIPELFWETLTRKIKSEIIIPEHREIFQIGETYGSKPLINSYIGTGKLDSQFDFNVYDDAVATFAREEVSFERLENGLAESFKIYGHHNLMGYISGNQDRARFISYASKDLSFEEDAKLAGWKRNIIISDSSAFDKLAMLHAFITTIPGIPVIYYGDEIGSPGGNDPDNRKMMKFDSLSARERKLRAQVSQLMQLRNNNLSLIYGDTEFLLTNDDQWAFCRSWFGEHSVIIFNKSDKESNLRIPLPFEPATSPQVLVNKETRVSTEGVDLSVQMAANSYEIILFKE